MRKFARVLVNVLYLLKDTGFLKETGWINSVTNKLSIDKNGAPIPWISYPFIDFIKKRLSHDMMLFEYGSGNSTLFWAAKLKKVVSVEHNKEWYEELKSKVPFNVKYILKEINAGYVETILDQENEFDIIVIDGRERVACAKLVSEKLNPGGVIIWDNSLREKYKEGIEFLEKKGFKHIDFRGLNPMGHGITATSIFYKQPNCLNI